MDEKQAPAVRALLSAKAVRERATMLFDHGLAGGLDHFTIDLAKLDACADAVAATTRANYPDLDVPFHARWRHFAVGGIDRWAALADVAQWKDAAAMARSAFDLAIVSVLLDAGAGSTWTYSEERTGKTWSRSEGLAVASFDLFASGELSLRPGDPFRIDAEALIDLTPDVLARAFQVGADNPLVGLEGRTALLNRLGQVIAESPSFDTGDDPRPGGLFDLLTSGASANTIAAPDVLHALLDRFAPIWPGRIAIDGVGLGDTWRHPLTIGPGDTNGLMPFHKLSQWLAYSLLEPLEWAGVTIADVDGLTGLPEYRNGGLFIDADVLRLKNPDDAQMAHTVGSRLVVEWRALTVALLDRIAPLVRARLGVDETVFPLAKVLEGGTWAAGRLLAKERRPESGRPPIDVVSDGTAF